MLIWSLAPAATDVSPGGRGSRPQEHLACPLGVEASTSSRGAKEIGRPAARDEELLTPFWLGCGDRCGDFIFHRHAAIQRGREAEAPIAGWYALPGLSPVCGATIPAAIR